MRVPSDAGAGMAKITLSMPDWKEGDVTPGTFDGLVIGSLQDIPAVSTALGSDDSVVRKEVMSALNRFGPKGDGVFRVLINQLNDPDATVRIGALHGLTGMMH